MVKFDFVSYMPKFDNLSTYSSKIKEIKSKLENDKEMLDWYKIDKCISGDEITDILETSKRVRKNSDVLIVIGIGGSFLGAKSVIDSLSPYFKNNSPEIIFAGPYISKNYMDELWKYVSKKRITINVISKSGTTLETNIVFDYLYSKMKRKYDEQGLKNRIIVTTDNKQGVLKRLELYKG